MEKVFKKKEMFCKSVNTGKLCCLMFCFMGRGTSAQKVVINWSETVQWVGIFMYGFNSTLYSLFFLFYGPHKIHMNALLSR